MKKLTHSAAARAAAFILCLLCGLTALLCAAGYFMTRIDRDRTLPEPDSVSVYKNGIRVLLNNALQEERYTGEYPELPSGYSYVATDTSTGKVLYDGRTKNAVPLGISGGCSSGDRWIDVQAYLEPKQTPGEELTLLRTSVGTLLRYQNAYLPVGIITAVLCLALFVFLMASMGKKPDGVKLRGIHRAPLDLFLAAALAAVAVPANFYSGINLLYNPLWVCMMPVTLMALWIGFVVLLTLCTISARLRAGKWWRNSIIYIVCRFVYRAVRGFVRALPIAWKGILVYAVVVLVNALGMILAFGAGSFFVFLLTLVLDAAGLYFVIHTVRQLKTLQTAAQKLAAGDLTYTVDTEKMYPVLKEHGDDLNAVSVGMSRAVNERMKFRAIQDRAHHERQPRSQNAAHEHCELCRPSQKRTDRKRTGAGIHRGFRPPEPEAQKAHDRSRGREQGEQRRAAGESRKDRSRRAAAPERRGVYRKVCCGGHHAGAECAGGGNVCHGGRAAFMARAG